MYRHTMVSLAKRVHRCNVSLYRAFDRRLPGASSSSRDAPRAASSRWARCSTTRAGSMATRGEPVLTPLIPLAPLTLTGVPGGCGDTAASMMGVVVVRGFGGSDYRGHLCLSDVRRRFTSLGRGYGLVNGQAGVRREERSKKSRQLKGYLVAVTDGPMSWAGSGRWGKACCTGREGELIGLSVIKALEYGIPA
jgi:hypothetical protein